MRYEITIECYRPNRYENSWRCLTRFVKLVWYYYEKPATKSLVSMVMYSSKIMKMPLDYRDTQYIMQSLSCKKQNAYLDWNFERWEPRTFYLVNTEQRMSKYETVMISLISYRNAFHAIMASYKSTTKYIQCLKNLGQLF